MSFMHRAVSAAFMPDTGSSSSSIDGLRGQRQRDPKQTLLAVRQACRRAPIARCSEADELEDLMWLRATSSRSVGPRAAARAALPERLDRPRWCRPIRTFSKRCWLWNTLVRWKVRTRPSAGDFVRLQCRSAACRGKRTSPLVGLQKAGDNVECRGLAGPVRADEADDLALARP